MTDASAGIRANGTNDYGWKHAVVIIDAANIGDFELMSNRRDLRAGKVRQLVKLLKEGGHFESTFVVNLRDGKYRLIDGNHRFESISKFLAEYPSRRVKVALNVYEDLSEEEELEKYTAWNLGAKQTTNDFIKLHWDEVPQFAKMQTSAGFPISIRHAWSGQKMEAKLLLNAYFVKGYAGDYPGPSMGNGQSFIAKSKLLTRDDLLILRQLMVDYLAVFGAPDSKSNYYRPAVFQPLVDIWLRNYEQVPSNDLQKRFRRVVGHHKLVEYAQQSGTMQTCQFARKDLLSIMNGKAPRLV